MKRSISRNRQQTNVRMNKSQASLLNNSTEVNAAAVDSSNTFDSVNCKLLVADTSLIHTEILKQIALSVIGKKLW